MKGIATPLRTNRQAYKVSVTEMQSETGAACSGWTYRFFDYYGESDAERVIVLMGSAIETAGSTANCLVGRVNKLAGGGQTLSALLDDPFH